MTAVLADRCAVLAQPVVDLMASVIESVAWAAAAGAAEHGGGCDRGRRAAGPRSSTRRFVRAMGAVSDFR